MWLNEEAIDVLVNYYYPKAGWLQDNVNWGPLDYEGPEANEIINDPLMQKIDIYDCKTRNAAGFSNVLQDLRFGSKTPKWRWQKEERRKISASNDEISWPIVTWLYVMMCHRITGSGASFENDHGYRNNIIQYWGKHRDIKDMAEDLVETKASGKPLFTSIGNQPPAPKKGTSNVDFMVKEHNLNIITRPARNDKFVRAQPVASAWNDGRILIPKNKNWTNIFLQEIMSFTGVSDLHDDQVDVLATLYDCLQTTKKPLWRVT